MKFLNKQQFFKKLLALLVITALASFLFLEWDSIFKIKVDFKSMVLILTFLFIYLITNGLFLKVLMSNYKVKLSHFESFGLSVLNTAGNYFSFFFGGTAIKAIYLKKKYNFEYGKFFESLTATYVIVFFINSLIAVLVIFLISLTGKDFLYLPFFIFLSASLSLLIMMFLPNLFINFKIRKIAIAAQNWKILSLNKPLLLKLSSIALINIILTGFIALLKFGVVGVKLNYLEGLYISSISSLSVFINITPASLGITEGLTVYASKAFSIEPIKAIMASGVERAATLIIVIPLGLILGHKLLYKKDKAK